MRYESKSHKTKQTNFRNPAIHLPQLFTYSGTYSGSALPAKTTRTAQNLKVDRLSEKKGNLDEHLRAEKETYAALVVNIKSVFGLLARDFVTAANAIANPHNAAIRHHAECIAYKANIGATIMVGTTITTNSESQSDILRVDGANLPGALGCTKGRLMQFGSI